MMFWLSSLPQFRQFRDFVVSTHGSSHEDSMEFGESVDEDVRRRTRPVRYLPSYASSYWMWYKGRYVTISRTKEESRWNPDKSTLEITLVSSVYINCPIPERFSQDLFP
jgi:chaperone BCS1